VLDHRIFIPLVERRLSIPGLGSPQGGLTAHTPATVWKKRLDGQVKALVMLPIDSGTPHLGCCNVAFSAGALPGTRQVANPAIRMAAAKWPSVASVRKLPSP
jgi:hypothetical protein